MAKTVDYDSFRDLNDPSKPVKNEHEPRVNVRWWEAPEGPELAAAVQGQVQTMLLGERQRISNYSEFGRMYGNEMRPISNTGYTLTTVNRPNTGVKNRIAFNVQQSCVDTLVSKMAKNKPRPYFLTSKGDSKIQRKAKKLNSFCSGIFYENDAYSMMPTSFRDGCVWGEGVIHVGEFHKRVRWTRVLPYQLFADYLETMNGPEQAKTLHWVRSFDRSTLVSCYPKQANAINAMESTDGLSAGATKSVSDTVTVIESWRLPSGPDSNDGIHCITAGSITLYSEPWKRLSFPFAIFRYSPRLHGFWGQGLVEQLTPIQTELNRCLMTVQRSFHLGGSFKILRHVTSKIIKSHLDNEVGTIIDWAGDHKPEYVVPPMVQPEIYQQIQTLKQMAYEQSGLSQLSATGQKPAGLNSGEAQRVYHDIETDRFQLVGQEYENFCLQLAALSIEEARSIWAENKDFGVKVPGKRFIETIDWGDVDLEDDEYVMQCYPVSKLPTDPAGRLEHIQELMQAGLIEPETGRRLLDYPDLEEEENLLNSQMDWMHQALDGIVEDGVYTPPYPAFNLQKQLQLCLEYEAAGMRDNLEPKRLEMLRMFRKQATNYMQAAQTPAPAPTPGMGQPQAQPAPAPVSNMLPNAPGVAA